MVTRRKTPGVARTQDGGNPRRLRAAEKALGTPDVPAVDRGGIVPAGGVPWAVSDRLGVERDKRGRISVRPVRLGKRWSEIIGNIDAGVYTWADLVKTLTPAELARGQIMDKAGRFSGRPPSLVPRAFHDACIRELMKRGRTLYEENYILAITAMTEVARSATKASDRIKAAQFIIERLEGKALERIEVTQGDPFKDLLEGAVATVAEDAAIANAQQYLDRLET